jgi:lipopolysaccharide export system protein LptA
MATFSRKSNSSAAVCAVLATGLLGVAEAAPAPCANQEIVLEAKPLEMDYRNNNAVLRDVVITQCGVRIQADEARITGGLDFENSHWTISGDVRITAEGGSLSSDKAIVAFRNKLISAATITGAPAQFEQRNHRATAGVQHPFAKCAGPDEARRRERRRPRAHRDPAGQTATGHRTRPGKREETVSQKN